MILRSYNEENARRKKFRILYLLAGLPIVAIILLFGVKTGTMFYYANNGITSFDEGDYVSSIEYSDQLKVGNVIEPWIAFYNSGTGKAANRQHVEGITDLKGALELADGSIPGSCLIRANLALAYEQYGDEFKAQGATQQALGFYNLGKQTIDYADPSCFPPPPPSTSENPEKQEQDEAGESMENTKERLEEKSEAANEGEPSETDSENGEGGESKEEKIKDQTDQTGKERADKENQQRGEQQGEGTEEGTGGGTKKPW